MAELNHPNCVTVHDYGRTADGVLYYAMEFLDGLDMQALVELGGPQPAGRVINLLLQACGALGEAHARGLIHRDIKPANLFVCRQHGLADMVKVLDFGVVKQLQAPAPESMVTREQVLIGTPLYMSPEAINHPERVDARSDLYSLGAVGYMLLVGRPVFEGASLVEICAHHLHSAPVPPSLRVQSVPHDLEQVLLRCLQKSPDARFTSADQVAASLAACVDASRWHPEHARSWWAERHSLVQTRRAESPSGVHGAVGLQQTVAIEAHDRTGERRLAETVADEVGARAR
jgi:serine/threonine-protein kinase